MPCSRKLTSWPQKVVQRCTALRISPKGYGWRSFYRSPLSLPLREQRATRIGLTCNHSRLEEISIDCPRFVEEGAATAVLESSGSKPRLLLVVRQQYFSKVLRKHRLHLVPKEVGGVGGIVVAELSCGA